MMCTALYPLDRPRHRRSDVRGRASQQPDWHAAAWLTHTVHQRGAGPVAVGDGARLRPPAAPGDRHPVPRVRTRGRPDHTRSHGRAQPATGAATSAGSGGGMAERHVVWLPLADSVSLSRPVWLTLPLAGLGVGLQPEPALALQSGRLSDPALAVLSDRLAALPVADHWQWQWHQWQPASASGHCCGTAGPAWGSDMHAKNEALKPMPRDLQVELSGDFVQLAHCQCHRFWQPAVLSSAAA